MQCKTCGREISDTAKFCPYCGSKTEPPHNSAENKTAETAYETTANTNAETAYGTETNKNSETAYGTEANKNAETAYGTKTSKTPETDRETFKNNTEDRFQTASAGDLDETKKFFTDRLFHFSSTLLRYGFPQSTLRHSEFFLQPHHARSGKSS